VNDEEILRELRESANRADGATTGTPLDAPLGTAFEAGVAAKVVASRRAPKPRRTWFAAAAAPLALAAAIALLIARPWRGPTGAAPLPEYSVEVSGGADTERGAGTVTASEVSAHRGDALGVLRPATIVREPLVARAFASSGGDPREIAASSRTSEEGSIEVRTRVADVAGDATSASLTIVVARQSAGLDARAIANGAAIPDGAKVVRIHVRVVP
jgi:hypothetical protein